MANSSRAMNLDLATWFDRASLQFRGLNPRQPGQWPLLPKVCAWVGAAALTLALGWLLLVAGAADQLDADRRVESGLKDDYRAKLGQAVNLSELRKQKVQVQDYVTQLERQLPGKAEMDALLSVVNQAGLGRSLQFELFRPGQVLVRDYYAELPITLRVTGRYHDIGAFASDVANLSRIVTLNNLIVSPLTAKEGTLVMDATAKTFRYLDTDEVSAQRKLAPPGAKK